MKRSYVQIESVVKLTESKQPAECSESCNDNNICTKDYCKDGKCAFEKVIPCCGNYVCEKGEDEKGCLEDCIKRLGVYDEYDEIIRKARDVVVLDLIRAKNLCTDLKDSYKIDMCLYELAELSQKDELCEGVSQVKAKDKCYANLAFKYDMLHLCKNLNDEWLKASCFSYAKYSKTKN